MTVEEFNKLPMMARRTRSRRPFSFYHQACLNEAAKLGRPFSCERDATWNKGLRQTRLGDGTLIKAEQWAFAEGRQA